MKKFIQTKYKPEYISQPKQAKKFQTLIKHNERVFIAGKTGSGKTYLVQLLLMTVPRLLVVDSKDGIDNEKWMLENPSSAALNKLKNNEPVRIRVVDDKQAFEYMGHLYDSGSGILFVDELTALIHPKSNPPENFNHIWMRGRSRGIGAWAATQAPVSIPLTTMREAEHFFCFRLNLEDDRRRMAKVMGEIVEKPIIDKHAFYYYNTDFKGDAIYFPKGIEI